MKRGTDGDHMSREQFEAQDDDDQGQEEVSRSFLKASNEGILKSPLSYLTCTQFDYFVNYSSNLQTLFPS